MFPRYLEHQLREIESINRILSISNGNSKNVASILERYDSRKRLEDYSKNSGYFSAKYIARIYLGFDEKRALIDFNSWLIDSESKLRSKTNAHNSLEDLSYFFNHFKEKIDFPEYMKKSKIILNMI